MRTSFSLSSLACASLIALACTAQAQASTFPVSPNYGSIADGVEYRLDPRNAGVLAFSTDAASMMSLVDAQILPIGAGIVHPATDDMGDFTSIDVTLPVDTVIGNSTQLGGTTYFGGTDVRYQGGFSIQVAANKYFSVTGGAITLANLHVDPVRQQVLADVSGANAVGKHSQVAVWNFSPISSGNSAVVPTCSYFNCQAIVSVNNQIGDLRFTSEGFDMVSRSLGLSPLAKNALYGVSDFGTITTSVPEPSGWALAAVGLVGIGLASRRRTATTH